MCQRYEEQKNAVPDSTELTVQWEKNSWAIGFCCDKSFVMGSTEGGYLIHISGCKRSFSEVGLILVWKGEEEEEEKEEEKAAIGRDQGGPEKGSVNT